MRTSSPNTSVSISSVTQPVSVSATQVSQV